MNSAEKWASLTILDLSFLPQWFFKHCEIIFSRKVSGDSNTSIFEKPFVMYENQAGNYTEATFC